MLQSLYSQEKLKDCESKLILQSTIKILSSFIRVKSSTEFSVKRKREWYFILIYAILCYLFNLCIHPSHLSDSGWLTAIKNSIEKQKTNVQLRN